MFDFLLKWMPFFEAAKSGNSSNGSGNADDSAVASPAKGKTAPGNEYDVAVASPAMSSTTNTTAASTPQQGGDNTLEVKEDGQTTPTTSSSSSPLYDDEIGGMDIHETYVSEESMQEYDLAEEAASLFETINILMGKQDEDMENKDAELKSCSSSDEGELTSNERELARTRERVGELRNLISEVHKQSGELIEQYYTGKIDSETWSPENEKLHERKKQLDDQLKREQEREFQLSDIVMEEYYQDFTTGCKKLSESLVEIRGLAREFLEARNDVELAVLQSLQDEHVYEEHQYGDDGSDKENEP